MYRKIHLSFIRDQILSLLKVLLLKEIAGIKLQDNSLCLYLQPQFPLSSLYIDSFHLPVVERFCLEALNSGKVLLQETCVNNYKKAARKTGVHRC